jgi:hypothetical protein
LQDRLGRLIGCTLSSIPVPVASVAR